MLALVAALVLAQNPWVSSARELLGVKYEFGARLQKNRGIDCLGVVLASAERATGCGWRSYSVNPTELIGQNTLGRAVEGLAPVSTEHLEAGQIEPGDVVMLLSPIENPAEPALTTLDGVKQWVWHVGIASGEGRWVVGDNYAGEVIETNLLAYLTEHRDEFAGVFIVRPSGQKPNRCRTHAPMSSTRAISKRQK